MLESVPSLSSLIFLGQTTRMSVDSSSWVADFGACVVILVTVYSLSVLLRASVIANKCISGLSASIENLDRYLGRLQKRIADDANIYRDNNDGFEVTEGDGKELGSLEDNIGADVSKRDTWNLPTLEERKVNPFLDAWTILLLRSGPVGTEMGIIYRESIRIEQHPEFFINRSTLVLSGFDSEQLRRPKQSIYILAVLFTFIGVLMVLDSSAELSQAENWPHMKAQLAPFFGSLAVKFFVSAVGILGMLIYSYFLGATEDRLEKKVAGLHQRILGLFPQTEKASVPPPALILKALSKLEQSLEKVSVTSVPLANSIKTLRHILSEMSGGILVRMSKQDFLPAAGDGNLADRLVDLANAVRPKITHKEPIEMKEQLNTVISLLQDVVKIANRDAGDQNVAGD